MLESLSQYPLIQVSTLGDVLLRAAHQYPEADAIVFPQARLSYLELAERSLERARSLSALGVGAGDHVGILLPTCLDFPEIFFGITLLGAVAVPMNARYQSKELAYVTQNADLVAIITTDRIAEHVNFVERLSRGLAGLEQGNAQSLELASAPRLRHVVLLGQSTAPGMLGQAEFEAKAREVEVEEIMRIRMQVRVRDPGLMLYTSGTTANPKGCPISHEAMVRNSMALGRHRYELQQQDRFWSPLPMFHIAAILPMVAIFDVGGAYLTMDYYDPGVALKMLDEENATATYPCFITIMADLIGHPDFESADLSRVRLMNSNFAVQPKTIVDKLQAAMPNTIQVGTFGMTETAGTVSTSMLSDDLEDRITRLGKPLPGLEVRIIDPETGEDADVDARGEVLVRGYSLFEGYYKDPEKTAEAIDSEGWYHTGDIGSLDAKGQMMFYGRLKDMLKVGGENVAAAEIEAHLQTHDAVKMAQVVGIPDARYQEVPAAFVELSDGASVSAEELIAHCKGEIASFKVPRQIRFVSEWPMSTSKIQKFRLRDQLISELEEQTS